eukprot:jgi/Tetstr1/454207/TSEL_041126.t1
MSEVTETIWYDDPRGFLTSGNFLAILPTRQNSYAGQLNAVLRLSLYYGLIVTLFRRDIDMLLIPLGVAAVTFLLYRSFQTSASLSWGGGGAAEAWTAETCVRPTRSNPFMNVLNSDERDRKPACDPLDPVVKSSVNAKFQDSLFHDIDDVWARNNAGRAFYTTPATTVPNDQTSFAEWLYGGMRAGGKQVRPPRNSIF